MLCFAQKSVLLGDASDVLAGDDSVLVPSPFPALAGGR